MVLVLRIELAILEFGEAGELVMFYLVILDILFAAILVMSLLVLVLLQMGQVPNQGLVILEFGEAGEHALL
jgi:hypothetical protein